MLDMIDDQGQRYNAATDHQNSTLALAENGTDAGDPAVAYDYTPYGNTDTTTNSGGDQAAQANPFTYTGSYTFDNGDKAMGHRYMSHLTERFTQQDPSWQEDNLYSYAECDPINNTDPSGLWVGCAVNVTGFFVSDIGYAGAAWPLAIAIGVGGAVAMPAFLFGAAVIGAGVGVYGVATAC
ncbi:RHS repeat-associated core domain-containing protein [Streptomonospora salina]